MSETRRRRRVVTGLPHTMWERGDDFVTTGVTVAQLRNLTRRTVRTLGQRAKEEAAPSAKASFRYPARAADLMEHHGNATELLHELDSSPSDAWATPDQLRRWKRLDEASAAGYSNALAHGLVTLMRSMTRIAPPRD